MLGSSDDPSMSKVVLKVGITPYQQCSYLPNQSEQLLVLLDKGMLNPLDYEQLLSIGFRRSGKDIYRPHCSLCGSCQSIRISVKDFKASRSQKRVLNKNKHLTMCVSNKHKASYYTLYQKYINQRHKDGAMYPASQSQYDGFILCQWLAPTFLEYYDQDKLVCVGVIDELPNSLSAMYCFYDPDLESLSLGTFSILQQLEYAKQQGKRWVYLGYQVDGCNKMNYKNRYLPHQRLILGTWSTVTKA